MSYQRYRPSDTPPVVKNLIIINIIVFIAQLVFDKGQATLTNKIGLWSASSENFKPYQIVTSMFAHSPTLFLHIVFNMFVLWSFGKILEMVWKEKRFLFFYLACGVGAAIVHLAVMYFRYGDVVIPPDFETTGFDPSKLDAYYSLAAPAVGASGAIMGIMAAFALLFPNTELYLMFLPIPIKAKWAVLGYVAIDLLGGIGQFKGDNIAHFAHLGGALTGLIIVLVWNKTNKRTLY